MKRMLVVVVILVSVLGIALWIRIRKLDAYTHAPSGGSGIIEGVEVNVSARIGARIQAIHVRDGQTVRRGQVLAELDCAEPESMLAEAKARLASTFGALEAAKASAQAASGNALAATFSAKAANAQAQVVDVSKGNMDREAERLTSLHASGAISNSQLDQVDTRARDMEQQLAVARANHEAAMARVQSAYRSSVAAQAQAKSAEASIAMAEAAVRRASIAVGECRLVAPRDAIVLTVHYEPGEVVLPGANLLTLVDLSDTRSTFYLPNAELARAAPGKAVIVHADPYPGESFPGTILSVSAKAEFTPRNVQTREDRDRLVYGVLVAIPNPQGKLRPGMPVDVAIEGTGR